VSILDRFRKTPAAVDTHHETTASEILAQGTVNIYLRDQVAILTARVQQLSFLLSCAPMMGMFQPKNSESLVRLAASRSPFAYVHPKTLAPFTWGLPPARWYKFPGSPTVWIPVSYMPEGRVIYSPLQIPGLEKMSA
jgi:hypothetical protein